MDLELHKKVEHTSFFFNYNGHMRLLRKCYSETKPTYLFHMQCHYTATDKQTRRTKILTFGQLPNQMFPRFYNTQ